MDEAYFGEEALRFEQLEEAEISDLEGAFVQVQPRFLLGLRSAMSPDCLAAQSLPRGTQCPGEGQGPGWVLGTFPTEMSPSWNLRQQQEACAEGGTLPP